ncbi:MAG: ubiquinol-cytochrome c reductase iron-sulfur subunit [Anaerolineales bacterium]|jgi:menaquinol-cytochrome c reductase iron-sulfur subunit
MVTEAENQKQPNSPLPISRRSFLALVSLGLGGLAAAIVSVPVVGGLIAPLLGEPPETWRSVGAVDKFKVGETVEVSFLDASPLPWAGVSAKTAAWLRRESQDQFIAFSVDCTHLGCPVKWIPDANLFMCPCHGGVYYKNGDVAAGPPPRALHTYPVRVMAGEVQVRTNPIPITSFSQQ